ncbi:MAG: esterase/lipase family protein [Clostridia bacterium]
MAGEEVVLVAGLWMPSLAMKLLAGRLAAAGFVPRLFAYRGRDPFEANVARLAGFVAGLPPARRHFVGHSLGGVLVLNTLAQRRDASVASAVLIGAPVRGCHAGRRLGSVAIGRWMMGASRPLWDERAAAWPRREPLGVIAGTAPIGLGRVLGAFPGANDGVVCVSETRVEGAAAHVEVPVGHSALIVSRHVARLVARFVASATFQ